MKAEPEAIWAANYIKDMVGKRKIEVETRVDVLYPNGKKLTFGHADAYAAGTNISAPHLFDLKTGQERNYGPQMAVYALGFMQRDDTPSMNVHLLYSERRWADRYIISRGEAEAEVFRIIDQCENPTRQPMPCDYCKWCAHRQKCTALNGMAVSVVGKDTLNSQMLVESISTPHEMGKFKYVADTLKQWIESVNEKALEFDEIDGYKKVVRKPLRSISNITEAISKLGMSDKGVMNCCTMSWSKLVKAYMEEMGVSKERAEDSLSLLLEAQITKGQEVKYWRKR